MKKLVMIFSIAIISLIYPVRSYAITRYILSDGKVYYENLRNRSEIEGADIQTFKNLDYFYAKDKNNVYYYGEKLNGVDPVTFKILDYSYTKDKNFVYHYRDRLDGVDPLTFKILDHDYAKDKNNVYYNLEILAGADSASFKILNFSYAKDKNNVYYNGNKIEFMLQRYALGSPWIKEYMHYLEENHFFYDW